MTIKENVKLTNFLPRYVSVTSQYRHACSYHKLRMGWTFTLSVLFILTAFTVALGQSVDPTPTPSPTESPSPLPTPGRTEEQKRLEDENATLELQKTNAELKKAIRDARPTATATPLEGKATLDANVSIEAEIISYKTMSALMDNIAAGIKGKFGSADRFLIYSQQDINDWRYYRVLFPTFKKRVEDLSTDYSALVAPPPGGPGSLLDAFETGSTIVRSFVDLISIFRTDTDIQGKSITIDDTALHNEAVRALKATYGQTVSVYNPAAFGPQLLATDATKKIPFIQAGVPQNNVTDGTPPLTMPPYTTHQPNQVPFFSSNIAELIGNLSIKKKAADKALAALTTLKADLEEKNRVEADRASKAEAIIEDQRLITRYAKKLNDKKILAKLKPAEIEALEDQKAQKEVEVARFEAVIKASDTKIPIFERRIEFAQSILRTLLQQTATLGDDIKDLTFITRRIDDLKNVNTAYNTFIESTVKVDAQGGASPLTLFVKGETMDALANDDNAYWIVLKAVKAGGNNRTQRNLIRYFTGAKITYNGAAIISYTLYDRSGRIVDSDTQSGYSHFMSSSEIKNFKASADNQK
jgi:hypothetical protein